MGYMRKFLNFYSRLAPAKNVKPPYKHVTQIGDPVLRKTCRDVPSSSFNTEELNNLLQSMTHVMKKYNAVGLAAPQVGVDLNVFMIQFTEDQVYKFDDKTIEKLGMSVLPLTVFINPSMRVVNAERVSHVEGCASVIGFFADVPRYKEVIVNGFNGKGESITKHFTGWSARIVQHEVDHIKGRLFTDIMDRSTFQCQLWEEINQTEGKIQLSYYQ